MFNSKEEYVINEYNDSNNNNQISNNNNISLESNKILSTAINSEKKIKRNKFKMIGKIVIPNFLRNTSNRENDDENNSVVKEKKSIGKIVSPFLIPSSTPKIFIKANNDDPDSGKENYDSGNCNQNERNKNSINNSITKKMIIGEKYAKYFGNNNSSNINITINESQKSLSHSIDKRSTTNLTNNYAFNNLSSDMPSLMKEITKSNQNTRRSSVTVIDSVYYDCEDNIFNFDEQSKFLNKDCANDTSLITKFEDIRISVEELKRAVADFDNIYISPEELLNASADFVSIYISPEELQNATRDFAELLAEGEFN